MVLLLLHLLKHHSKIAKSSLEAKKHVFVEKPISLNVLEAENYVT